MDKAGRVKEKINQMYWNKNEGYFYDTIRPDGKPDSKIRPNAMVTLMYRQVSNKQAQQALTRIERSDMTTDWGVRTLSSDDPNYNPEIYHSGEVWPLVTGWTAFIAYLIPGLKAIWFTPITCPKELFGVSASHNPCLQRRPSWICWPKMRALTPVNCG